MARQVIKVQIEGLNYEITQLGAVQSRQLSVLFVQLVGPLLSKVFGNKDLVGAAKGGAGKEVTQEAGLAAVSELADALQEIEPTKLEPLWDAFSENAWVIGADAKTRMHVKTVFDDHFAGDAQFAMWRFFIESAKANFVGFLARAAGSASAIKAQ